MKDRQNDLFAVLGRGFRSQLVLAVLILLAATSLSPSLHAEELSPEEDLAAYYLWEYYSLEGSSLLGSYIAQEFGAPHPLYPEYFIHDGLEVFYRLNYLWETSAVEVGFRRLNIGPVSFSGSTRMPTFNQRVLDVPSAVGPIEWSAAGGETTRTYLDPSEEWSVGVGLWDIVEASYQYNERSIRTTAVIGEDQFGDPIEEESATVRQTGEILAVSLRPGNLFSRGSALYSLPSLTYEQVRRDLRPRGYTTTLLYAPRRLLSEFLFQFGESEVTDIRFVRLGSYVFFQSLLAEIDIETTENDWFHDDWSFRRGRVGINLLAPAIIRDSAPSFSDAVSNRQATPMGEVLFAGIYATYEWRNLPAELIPGTAEEESDRQFGFALQLMSRFPNFDFYTEIRGWVPPFWAGEEIFGGSLQARPPFGEARIELRYRFPATGQRWVGLWNMGEIGRENQEDGGWADRDQGF